MLHNVLEAWSRGSLPNLRQKRGDLSNTLKPNEIVLQSSFEFSSPPSVVFVKDMESKVHLSTYQDIPEVSLTKAEKDVLATLERELSQNRKFYNGKHILISGVYYDDENNRLYLQVKRVDYVFMNALEKKKFPEGSRLYHSKFFRTGVLAPFMTKDNYTAFMRRNDHLELMSAASGFLEADKDSTPLSTLVTHTAINESREEFLDNARGQLRVDCEDPEIKSLSIRYAEGYMPAVEFVVPIRLECHHKRLNQILESNAAKDAREHKKEHHLVPLSSYSRREVADGFLKRPHQGSFLYGPMLSSCGIIAARNSCDRGRKDFVPQLPENVNTSVTDIGLFKRNTSIPKQVSSCDNKEEQGAPQAPMP